MESAPSVRDNGDRERPKAAAGQLGQPSADLSPVHAQAAYVPPPPELVADLMVDLCSFCNEDTLPTVAQAALAHAQFETIHPFADGNGRTGRAPRPGYVIEKAAMRQDIGWALLILAGAGAIGLAVWAIHSGYLRRRREGQPASAASYLAVSAWLLVDTAAFNLILPGGEIAGAVLAVFCSLRAVQLRRRSGVWR